MIIVCSFELFKVFYYELKDVLTIPYTFGMNYNYSRLYPLPLFLPMSTLFPSPSLTLMNLCFLL